MRGVPHKKRERESKLKNGEEEIVIISSATKMSQLEPRASLFSPPICQVLGFPKLGMASGLSPKCEPILQNCALRNKNLDDSRETDRQARLPLGTVSGFETHNVLERVESQKHLIWLTRQASAFQFLFTVNSEGSNVALRFWLGA